MQHFGVDEEEEVEEVGYMNEVEDEEDEDEDEDDLPLSEILLRRRRGKKEV